MVLNIICIELLRINLELLTQKLDHKTNSHVHTLVDSGKQTQSACPNCGDLNPLGNTS